MATFARLMVFFLAAPVLIAAELHVSTTGNDTNAGTASRPFATIQRAQKAVRDFRAAQQGGQQEVDVILHAGTYWQTNTLTFTNTDSGSAGAPVVYTNAPGEEVAISGGRVISGTWTQSPGKPYWQISIPDVQAGKWTFNSLSVNGQSAICARYPNEGEKELRSYGPEPGGDPRRTLVYQAGDFNPSWTNQQDIDIVFMGFWTGSIHGVSGVDPVKRVLRFANFSYNRTVDAYERLPRYYLRNVFEKLDSPGEWYLNKSNGILYYYPRPGENLSSAEVIAPVVKSPLVALKGNLASNLPVQYIQFRGIHFRHADTDIQRYDAQYRQGHMFLDGSVSATVFRQGLFQGCTFEQLGDYALNLADGCRDVIVQKCHFWDLGAGAVLIGVTDLSTVRTKAGSVTLAPNQAEPLRLVTNIVVDNNIVHRVGTIWNGCYGIVNRFASYTKITHNEIFDTHWDAIGLDARWDNTTNSTVYSEGNEVAYNDIHQIGLNTETDGAGIYQYGPLDTHIHHNLVHDTFPYPYNTGLHGVYLDAESTGALVEKNLVYNLGGVSYWQSWGDSNLFSNNIGAFARDGFFSMGSLNNNLNYAQITRNIYLTTNNIAQGGGYPLGDKPSLVADNFYQTLQSNTTLLYNGNTLTNWQKLGWDIGSVEGNAGFADPLNGDFSLSQTSAPVATIGFVPFGQELASVGLYGDPSWTNLPTSLNASLPMRQPYQYCTGQDLAFFNDFSLDPNLYSNGTTMPIFSVSQADRMIITNEVSGINGSNCIKVIENTNNTRGFDPYGSVALYGLNQGRVQIQCSFMQPTNAPAGCQIDCRSSGSSYKLGPTFTISSNGLLKAGGWTNQLRPGQWHTFRISFGLGTQGNGTYSLTISNSSGVTNTTLPFSNTNFSDMGNLTIFSGDTNSNGSYYLDAISVKTAAITFPALGPATYSNGLTMGLGAVSTTLLPVAYSSTNTDLVSISGTNLTVLGAGTATIVASQNGDATHLASTPVTNQLVITRATNAITWTNLASPVTYSNGMTVVLGASASSGLAVSYTSLSTNMSISGSTVTILGAGTAQITAAQAGNVNYAAAMPVTNTLVVNKAPASVSISGTNVTYDGSAKGVTVTTVPTNLAVEVTYNGSTNRPVSPGNYSVVASVTDANYTGSNMVTLVVNPGSNAITWTNLISPVTYSSGLVIGLGALSGSGLPVNYSTANTNLLGINGTNATVLGAGTVTIVASVSDTNNSTTYSATNTLVINKAAASVSFSGTNVPYSGGAQRVRVATVPSGLNNSVTYNGLASYPTNAGSYAVMATVTDANYSGSGTTTFIISRATNSIAWTNLVSPVTYSNGMTVGLRASASSGLSVTYYSASTNVSLSGTNLTVLGAGTATITASQAGNSNYLAATPVTNTLVVNKAGATVLFTGTNATYDGSAKGVTVSTVPAGLPNSVTYNALTNRPTNVGIYGVVATVTDANYTGSGTTTLTISQATNTILWTNLASPVTYSNGMTIGLGAVASSGLPVSYATASTNLVGVSGTNAIILGAGTATIVATQAGDGNYLAATPVTNTLVITVAAVTRRQTNALNAGCTWISFNVVTPDGTWGGLLPGDQASDNDVILGNEGSLTYHSGTWYPSDPGFRPSVGSMYMVISATARNMGAAGTVPGLPLASSLAAGWNWIGSPGVTNTTLATMIPGLQPADGDVIVDQRGGMATYYQRTWYSNAKESLQIRPGLGYKIYLHSPQNVQLY